jgi:hypothetical protein
VHPPDVCFPGAGFYPVKPKEKFAVPGTNAEASENFWVGDFEKSTPTGENYLRVFWSWNGMGRWRAADVPRVTFARAPFLYKMYVTRSANRNNNRLDDDPCVEFLTALIPVLNQVLFDLPPDRISPTPSL